ncbi:MAG: hypothetical protein IKZ88_05785 [Neisseriaceae bacterium]|nr:hypothetical protein [Neisseriaceae bacterium]
MKKSLIATILLLACFSASAQEVDNSKMRQAVRRVISFVDANCVIESGIARDETGGFKQLDSILNTYKLGKNVFYLGKGNKDGEICAKDNVGTCVDLFAVDVAYACESGNGAVVNSLFLSSSWAGLQIDFRPNIAFEGQLDMELGLYSEIKQTKKAPNPEFLVTTLDFDEKEDGRFPTFQYEQKFRFNPKTLKMQAISKKKFVGKVKE